MPICCCSAQARGRCFSSSWSFAVVASFATSAAATSGATRGALRSSSRGYVDAHGGAGAGHRARCGPPLGRLLGGGETTLPSPSLKLNGGDLGRRNASHEAGEDSAGRPISAAQRLDVGAGGAPPLRRPPHLCCCPPRVRRRSPPRRRRLAALPPCPVARRGDESGRWGEKRNG